MVFLRAIESLASAIEVREVGAPQENFGLWLSLVERLPRVQEVQGSNPCSPTFRPNRRGTRNGHGLTRMEHG